jgi:hypothetical protein
MFALLNGTFCRMVVGMPSACANKVQPAFHDVGCCVKAVVSWPLSDCVLHQLAVSEDC